MKYNDYALNTVDVGGYDVPQTVMTPSNGLSDGIAPAGGFKVAPYLPIQRFDSDKRANIVIGAGKIVALDVNGAVVPAGLRFEAEAYATGLATSVAAADAQAVVRYTAQDVAAGVKNFKGQLVTDGEPVVKSFFTGTTLNNEVSFYVGVAQYNVFQHAGGDNINPATLTGTNFNIQPVISFMCDYHQQYPVVKDVATVRSAPLRGIAAFVGMPSEYARGGFVTYDRESNFVPCAKHGFGTTDLAAVVGQITAVRTYKDPTTDAVVGNHNFLDRVVAPTNQATASVLNQIPNSRNDGMGTFITYSNGYAVIEFGLHFR